MVLSFFPTAFTLVLPQIYTQREGNAGRAQAHSGNTVNNVIFIIMLGMFTLRFCSISTKPKCHLTFRGNAKYVVNSYQSIIQRKKMLQL